MSAVSEPNGVLIINKHAGVTSHDIVFKVRRLFGTKKVGHTGTLDPMATGVLVVLVGRAAKAAEYLTSSYVQNAWSRKQSNGLAFVSNNDGTCYVAGIGTCEDTELILPMYSPAGELVTAIGEKAFRKNQSIIIC